MSKFPNAPKSKLKELDDFIGQQQTQADVNTFSQAGVDPSKIPTDPVQQAVMLQQVKMGNYKGDKEDTQSKIIAAANGIEQTIKNKKNMNPEDFNSALQNYASQLAAAKGFAEGGKVLSGPELTILAGQIPIFKKRVPTMWEKLMSNFTGELPNVTAEPQDTEAQLLTKAQRLKAQFGATDTGLDATDEELIRKYSGKQYASN